MTPHITLRLPSLSHGLRPALLQLAFAILLSLCLGAAWRSALAQSSAAPANQVDRDARPLVVGQPIERELEGGQSHSYRITVAAGQYLNAVVDQRGIDVVVTLFGPDGKQLIEIDSPNGKRGPEPVSWIVETGGDYQLAVRSLEKDAARGRYELRIVELRTAIEQDRALVEARKLLNESNGLRGKSKYDEAISLAERALAIQERILGADHLDVGNSLDIIANMYDNKMDSAKAEPLYQRALAIREKAFGLEHSEVADSLNDLALLYYNKADYAKAEPLFQRALTIKEKAFGLEHQNVALPINNLALLYLNKGDFAKAEPLFQRALAISEKTLGPEHPSIALSINNLAIVYFGKGDYAKCEPLYQRALAIAEKAFGSEHPNVAPSINNLALLYMNKGDFSKTEPLYQRTLAIFEKAFGAEHPSVALPLGNLAALYTNKGDYPKAEPLFQRALAIYERTLGAEHPNVALTLSGLAGMHTNKGDYVKAEPLFQRALAIFEKALGPEHPNVALSINNLAFLYNNNSDYAKAEPLFQRALAISEKTLGPEHRNVAVSLLNLADIYRNKGDLAKAESLTQRALAIFEKALGPEHFFVAGSLDHLVTLYRASGQIAQAVMTQRRSAEIIESNLSRNLEIGSERQKLAYLARFLGQSHRIISLHLRSFPKDSAARDLAVTTILSRKGRALDVMTDSIAALRRRSTPQDQKLLDQLKDIRSQLARLTLNGPQRITPAEHQARIKTLEEQTEKLEADISSRSAEFRALSQPVTIAAVQAAIPGKSALVEFFAYRPFDPKANYSEPLGAPRYVAYVLRREGEVKWVELGEAKSIDEAVDKLREALRDPNRRDVKQLAREVDRLVMDPLRPLIGNTRRVFLSPDGALNLVPFAALVDKSDHYLVKHFEFSYLTSGRDLLRLQLKQSGARSAMVIANPDFGESKIDGGEGSRGIKLKYQPDSASSNSESSILSDAFFPPLPGTADEAKALKAMLPDAAVLTRAQATEAALKQAANPGILHIATHGFFLSDVAALNESRPLKFVGEEPAVGRVENPLLRSGLALAGANLRKTVPGQEDDGVLTASEASALDLYGTKLVVLSACDTGVGEVRNGDGVFGLRRALALAGAETQVMSLWPVNDKATRDLMIGYYKRLLGGSGRSEALREAQLRMLAGEMRDSGGSSRLLSQSARQTATGRTKDYSHPYYWACFIQSGEWANLDGKRD